MEGPFIPLVLCQHGHTYHVIAQNFSVAVFDANAKHFVGIREKFEVEYLYTEHHIEVDPNFSTALPYALLEVCPVIDLREGIVEDRTMIYNAELYEYLTEANQRHSYLYEQ